jgi:DNA polymerase-4
MSRVIMHADLDAFYASVEQLDHPELRGRPVVVGGPPEHRGVVAAASYEARAHGVHSAMPMVRALRLCPDAVRVSPRFERYDEKSRQVMAIFRKLAPVIEPLSLDEAFLDVSAAVESQEQAREAAVALKQRVHDEAALTLSVGVGTNKTVAKIASDMEKPDGLVVVPFGEEAAFLAPLPVRKLWGVGPRSEQQLIRHGMHTIGDIAARSPDECERLFGSRGAFLWQMAHGTDDRRVETGGERKSIGAETTFARDLPDGDDLRAALDELAEQVGQRLGRSRFAAHTVALKLRYANFRTITRQTSVKAPVHGAIAIAAIGHTLLDAVAAPDDRFRLLGLQCAKLVPVDETQPPLFEEPTHSAGA